MSKPSNKIVVVHGASGHLGRHIVDELLARGLQAESIVTPVRNLDAPTVKELQKLGVKVVKADLTDKPALIEAYKGAHTVVHVPIAAGTLDRIVAAENSIQAAQAAKVGRFVAIGAGNGRTDSLITIAAPYLHLEAATRGSGLPWLIVRMGLYAENDEALYKEAAQTGVLVHAAKPGDRTPYITRRDIASGIAAAVLRWDLNGKTFDLEGQASISWEEQATKLSVVLGKKVVYKQVSLDEFANALSKYYGPAMAKWAAPVKLSLSDAANAGEFVVNNDLYELTGKIAEPFDKYLETLFTQKK